VSAWPWPAPFDKIRYGLSDCLKLPPFMDAISANAAKVQIAKDGAYLVSGSVLRTRSALSCR
jgi:hypothetical protein